MSARGTDTPIVATEEPCRKLQPQTSIGGARSKPRANTTSGNRYAPADVLRGPGTGLGPRHEQSHEATGHGQDQITATRPRGRARAREKSRATTPRGKTRAHDATKGATLAGNARVHAASRAARPTRQGPMTRSEPRRQWERRRPTRRAEQRCHLKAMGPCHAQRHEFTSAGKGPQ